MTIAIVFVSWVLACCLALLVVGVARMAYTAGYLAGRESGISAATRLIERAPTELEPYVPEHFDERGRRSMH